MPGVLIAGVVLALVGYVFYVVARPAGERHPSPRAAAPAGSPTPSVTPSATASPAAPPAVFPPPGKVFLGLQTGPGPYDFAPVDAFTAATQHQPGALQFTQGWADDQFHRAAFDRIAARKMLPILAWEPWDHKATGRGRSHGDQPAYRLSRIIAGDFDPYIRSWAEGIKTLGYPVAVRFAHEMNGFWYPWCEQSNGNRRGDYVKAYRHVHQIFAAAGADKVIWIWSPNVTYPSAEPLRDLYPGDSYVDWIGLSGYYGTAGVEQYRSFDRIFTDTFAELRRFNRKPIVITETAATDSAGQKARWIRTMFQQLPRHGNVIGVVWFELVNELDWRVANSPAAAKAFADGARSSRYQVAWSPNTIPLS